MTRTILGLLVVSLLALPAAAQQRPSVAGVDAAQKRTNAAICAKADADGDSYRPFVCEPRCDCFAALLGLGNTPSTCAQTSPGIFDISFVTPPGTCNSGSCSNSSFAPCSIGAPFCPVGETCISGGGPIPAGSCRRTCATNAGCPPAPSGLARLSGVTPPDSPNAVECIAGATSTKINSNDALECLDQIEAITGPCQ